MIENPWLWSAICGLATLSYFLLQRIVALEKLIEKGDMEAIARERAKILGR